MPASPPSWIVAALLALAVVCPHVLAQSVECTRINTTTLSATCAGTVYSIATLAPNGNLSRTFAASSGGYLWFVKHTRGGLSANMNFCQLPGPGYVAAQYDPAQDACYPLAQVKQIISWSLNGDLMTVLFGGGEDGRTVTYQITCGSKNATFVVGPEFPTLNYNFLFSHCSACKGGCKAAFAAPVSNCIADDEPEKLKATCGNKTYSLAKLASGLSNRFEKDCGNYTLYFQIVNSGLPAQGAGKCNWTNSEREGSVVGVYYPGTKTCAAVASVTYQFWRLDANVEPPVLTVTFSDDDNYNTVDVVVWCNAKKIVPTLLSATMLTPRSYRFTFEHCSSCPGSC